MRTASSHDWEQLIVGRTMPRPKVRWLLAAHSAALRVARAFTRDGLPSAVRILEKVTAHPEAHRRTPHLPEDARLFLAREVAWQARGLVRTLYGRRLCLFESLTATAAIRTLGLPAQTVIGYATGFGAAATPVHAWSAVGDVPVSDDQYVWQRYTEITRYPTAREDIPCPD